jgi:hypothetical protein
MRGAVDADAGLSSKAAAHLLWYTGLVRLCDQRIMIWQVW